MKVTKAILSLVMYELPYQSALPKQAITAALEARWEEAVGLNQNIIEEDPDNIDALNRLARAYYELGDLVLAKKFYNQTLKFDQYNPIAIKNLKIIQSFKNGIKTNNHQTTRITPSMFLQEPGRTKLVSLIKVAEPQRLSNVSCGMEVLMAIKNRGIAVTDMDNNYLGVLPDDTAFQIVRLIKGGNKFQTIVKAVKVNGLTVMIREIFRASKFRNQPSFLETGYIGAEVLPTMAKDETEEEILSEEEEN